MSFELLQTECNNKTNIDDYHHHNHHEGIPTVRIYFTHSRHPSLLVITLDKYSSRHPLSAVESIVRADECKFLVCPVGVHKRLSFMSSFFLHQQCSSCLACLAWMVCEMGQNKSWNHENIKL